MQNMTNTMLPKEVQALVQHIELNRAGWWDRAVHRLVVAAVWMSKDPPNLDSIQASLKTTFKLNLSKQKLSSALGSLDTNKMLVRLQGGTYRIPDQQRAIFEKEIKESEKVEFDAKEQFCKLVIASCPELEPDAVWKVYENEFLAPLIKQVGANAYRMIAGENMTVDNTLVNRFLRPFEDVQHQQLRLLVSTFLDPKNPEVCAYISRMLHAQFCVEASGLSEEVIAKLNSSVGKQIRFRMFVDTNFLFSLLELHENPSNAAAQELKDLVSQLNGNPKFELVITPNTIEEAKTAIRNTKSFLTGIPTSPNFTHAALHAGLSGMAARFFSERQGRSVSITPDEWFGPFLNDFVAMAGGKGVTLFNEKLDGYSTRQDVVDDINSVMKYEEKRPKERRKTYEKVAHDMILWHFVNDKRPAYVESPIDANEWILTVDFRLIGFGRTQTVSSRKKSAFVHSSNFTHYNFFSSGCREQRSLRKRYSVVFAYHSCFRTST